MKLAAIYNVWDGVELLKGSIDCVRNHVDIIIIVYQTTSNFGEQFNPLPAIDDAIPVNIPIELIYFEPLKLEDGTHNEKLKRNKGIEAARKAGCTHFLLMDCDEYYEDFGAAKQEYIDSGHKGSVCALHTYFKNPTLRLMIPESYYVPFIHELRHDTVSGRSNYPFYVDPTRNINESDVVVLSAWMHHFSWVRKDIGMKVRNSSAKANIAKSNLLEDWKVAKAGMFVRDYHTELIEVPNMFNIEI